MKKKLKNYYARIPLWHASLASGLVWLMSYILYRQINESGFLVAHSIITYVVVFITAGMGLADIIANLFRLEKNDIFLFLTLSSLISIFVVPALIGGISFLTGLNSAVFVGGCYLVLHLLPTIGRSDRTFDLELKNKAYVLHPITMAVALIAAIHVVNLLRYDFMPGLDTYTWVMTYETSLADRLWDLSESKNRVLFAALIGIVNRMSGLSLFNIFKYFMPFLGLLTVPPLWLLARELPKKFQLIILCASLMSPGLILDQETTRPHVIVLYFLFAMVGFLYAAMVKDNRRLAALSIIFALLGNLFHPVFSVMTLLWLVSLILIFRTEFARYPLLGAAVLVATGASLYWLGLKGILHNAQARLSPVWFNFLSGNWNLTFPGNYVSDGVEMGWPGLKGAMKFYGFYAGPITLAVLLSILVMPYVNKWRVVSKSIGRLILAPLLFPLTAIFIFFLVLAELISRFGNVAYLPDRAWMYVVIISTLFLFAILRGTATFAASNYAVVVLTSLYLVSVSGSFYINNALAYTIPEAEFKAAEWINNNLPLSRTFFTSSSKNVLRYYARATLLPMPSLVIQSRQLEDILRVLDKYREVTQGKAVYIYYAITDERNPYKDRPYLSSFTGRRSATEFPALNGGSDKFKLIYLDPDKVYIWQVQQ